MTLLNLAENPEITAGFRFMVASLAQAVAFLTINYAHRIEPRYDGHKVVLAGWAIEAQAWAIHQFYYFVCWMFLAKQSVVPQFWHDFRWVTSLALCAGAVGYGFIKWL